MSALVWCESEDITQLLASHVGQLQVTRPALLQSAFDAPQNAYWYADVVDLHILAATYADRIAAAHALADGNKRLAVTTFLVFLALNGAETACDSVALAEAIARLAAKQCGVDELATLLRGKEENER